MTEIFPIYPAHLRFMWVVLPLGLIVLGVILLVYSTTIGSDLAASRTSHAGSTSWIPWVTVVLLLVVIGVVAYSRAGARNARFLVEPDGLRLKGDFYGRFVPRRQLRLADARVVDLRDNPDLAPVLRLMGTGISGYRAGWFRLRNGERALLYLTDPSHVAYVPTTEGYSILLSVRDPSAFLSSLNRLR